MEWRTTTFILKKIKFISFLASFSVLAFSVEEQSWKWLSSIIISTTHLNIFEEWIHSYGPENILFSETIISCENNNIIKSERWLPSLQLRTSLNPVDLALGYIILAPWEDASALHAPAKPLNINNHSHWN